MTDASPINCPEPENVFVNGDVEESWFQSKFTPYFCEEFVNYLLNHWLGHVVVIETTSGHKMCGVLVAISPVGEVGLKHCIIFSPLPSRGYQIMKKNVLKGSLYNIRSISRAHSPVSTWSFASGCDVSSISAALHSLNISLNESEFPTISASMNISRVPHTSGTMNGSKPTPVLQTRAWGSNCSQNSDVMIGNKPPKMDSRSRMSNNNSSSGSSRRNYDSYHHRTMDTIPRFRRNATSGSSTNSNVHENKNIQLRGGSPGHDISTSPDHNADHCLPPRDTSLPTSALSSPAGLPHPFIYPYYIPMPYSHVPVWGYAAPPPPVMYAPYYQLSSCTSPSIMNYTLPYVNTVTGYYPTSAVPTSIPSHLHAALISPYFNPPTGMTQDQAFLYNLATALLLYNMYHSSSGTAHSNVTSSPGNPSLLNHDAPSSNDGKAREVANGTAETTPLNHHESSQT